MDGASWFFVIVDGKQQGSEFPAMTAQVGSQAFDPTKSQRLYH